MLIDNKKKSPAKIGTKRLNADNRRASFPFMGIELDIIRVKNKLIYTYFHNHYLS
jgi:hypothetical protein